MLAFFAFWFGGLLLIFAVLLVSGRFPATAGFLMAGMLVVGGIVAGIALCSCPRVTLTPEGVTVKYIRNSKFYAWSAIRQAGILQLFGGDMFYNVLILVKPGGSKRRYKDRTFLFRNIGRLIEIPYTEEAQRYVVRHYGPLDFNKLDGRDETGSVVE